MCTSPAALLCSCSFSHFTLTGNISSKRISFLCLLCENLLQGQIMYNGIRKHSGKHQTSFSVKRGQKEYCVPRRYSESLRNSLPNILFIGISLEFIEEGDTLYSFCHKTIKIHINDRQQPFLKLEKQKQKKQTSPNKNMLPTFFFFFKISRH